MEYYTNKNTKAVFPLPILIILCLSLLLAAPVQAIWQPVRSAPGEGQLKGHKHEIYSLAFSPDGQYLASGSFDGSTRIWDTRTWAVVHELAGHSNWVSAVAFSPDGQWLATAGLDRRIQIWDVHTGHRLHSAQVHHKGVLTLAFSPDGQWLASGGLDARIVIHQVHPWQLVRTLPPQSGGIAALAFSVDGKYLASTAYEDPVIRFWDPVSGTAGPVLTGHIKEIYALAFSANGRYLASGGEDRIIRIWDLQSQQTVTRLAGHSQSVWSLAFSPDSRFLASGSLGDRSLRLWTVPQGVNAQTLNNIPDKTYTLAFAPHQPWLASGHSDALLRLWENIPIHPFPGLGHSTAEHLLRALKPELQIQLQGIDDDQQGQSHGNQNARADAGEQVEILLEVRNVGPVPLQPLELELHLWPETVSYRGDSHRYRIEYLGLGQTRQLCLPIFIPRQFKGTFHIDLRAHSASHHWHIPLEIEPGKAYPLPHEKGKSE